MNEGTTTMSERRIALFNCSSGVAGDMLLASLLDAGASLDFVTKVLGELNISGWTLDASAVSRAGIRATQMTVEVDDERQTRSYAEIVALLERAPTPQRIKERSLRIFRKLAQVEAAIHGVEVSDVHFHEVGGHDTIIDIVGTAAALEDLGIDQIFTSPIAVGHGTVSTLHGTIPSPAPATVALLQGSEIVDSGLPLELATPTGAAILATLSDPVAPLPPLRIEGQGFGAGARDLVDRANVVQVILATIEQARKEYVALLETTIDDVTGEQLSVALDSLLAAGALDTWAVPAEMKKRRTGFLVAVISSLESIDRLTQELMRATGTLGVRSHLVARSVLERKFTVVDVLGYAVRVKASPVRAKPEADDVRAVVEATGKTVFEVEALALRAFLEKSEDGTSSGLS
jgi:pyridinium-3,5-bisthiocarboxylic acid mononucleotide nickel chelatase